MKRLTFEGNFCDIAMCTEERGGSFCEDGYCSQRKVWERLKEYEDMEEQGLLIKLPCKIGDAVYRICRFKRGENWKKEAKFIRHSKLTRSNLFRIMLDGEFGKTVFLTLEEAEKALEAQHE